MFIFCMVCVVCVDFRCVVLDDDFYAGVEWVFDVEVVLALVIVMLFVIVRVAFIGCYRIFWIVVLFVLVVVIYGNIFLIYGACVYKGFGRALVGVVVEWNLLFWFDILRFLYSGNIIGVAYGVIRVMKIFYMRRVVISVFLTCVGYFIFWFNIVVIVGRIDKFWLRTNVY